MTNRVEEAAIKVLQEHAVGIKVDPTAFGGSGLLTIRVPGENPREEIREVASAVAALAVLRPEKYEVSVDNAWNRVHVVGDEDTPVKGLVQKIADLGVNFPGSNEFRSRAR